MSQAWDPERYAEYARFVSDLGLPVVDLLDPQPGEQILDIGCGDGVLTERLVAAGSHVVAIDSSPEQIWASLKRGLDARIVDAAHLDFDGCFDAVFSNAALHWITTPEPVISGIWRALKPGGRFVGELGGSGCVASVRDAFGQALARREIDAQALDPWYFPTSEQYGALLRAQGFRIDANIMFPRPTPLTSDIRGWLETFAQPFLTGVSEAERPALLDEVRSLLRPRLLSGGGVWVVDYVRLRVAATKPA